jgi:zinc/manganese transport system ATP-binding protein
VSHALNEVANYVERIALVLEGGFRIGPTAEIMTEETLSEMYGLPVEVDEVHGHRIVVARRLGTAEIRAVGAARMSGGAPRRA